MVGSLSSDGKSYGHVYVSRVHRPAAISAALSLRFEAEALAPTPQQAKADGRGRVVRWFQQEKEEHGVIWGVVGFGVMAILALLAL